MCGMLCVRIGRTTSAPIMDIQLVHVRKAWRRQQLAEVMWHQLVATVRLPRMRAVVRAPCCQSGPAGRLWTRLKFSSSAAVQAAMEGEYVVDGDHHMECDLDVEYP